MTIELIALNHLIASPDNVRKTGADEGIAELAASIEAHGLLQPLVVKKVRKGRYEVVAGQRRHKACLLLAERGVYADNHLFACSIQDRKADSTEISLAENVMRVAMHPADQFEAFRAMIDGGSAVEAVAVRFGVTPRLVEQRMKLARVAPDLLQAYRDEDISLETLQAFAVSDDHAAQMALWDRGVRQGWQIRKALTEGEPPVSGRLAQFVGLEVYEQAGGTVRRDLFDDEEGGTIMDKALLDRLAQAKLADTVTALQEEGWSWVEVRDSFDWHERAEFDQTDGEAQPLPDDRQANLDALNAEQQELSENSDDEAWERYQQIDEEIEGIEAERIFVFAPDFKARAGAIVHIGHDGDLEIERGLTPKAEQPEEAEPEEAAHADPLALPASLIEYLTAEKTAAIRTELASSPRVALAAVAHRLALNVFFHGGNSCLDIFARCKSLHSSMKEFGKSAAVAALNGKRDAWVECQSASKSGSDAILMKICAIQLR